MLFTFSALISSIYWCGSVSHQQILMVRYVAPAEIIGAANAAPVSTPMCCTVEAYGTQMGQTDKRTSIFRRKSRVFLILEIHFSEKGQCSSS